MAQKTVGYVRLEWICPNCGLKNPGPQKTCSSCGTPQPENVQFQRAADEKLLKTEEVKKDISRPDIHCGYCGTRNTFDQKKCTQCGGDLTGGKIRLTGQKLGALNKPNEPDIACEHCKTKNPVDYQYCSNCGASLAKPAQIPVQPPAGKKQLPIMAIVLMGIAAIALCALVIFLINGLTKRDALSATVQDVSWQRSVVIEAFGPVQKEGWEEEIPPEAVIGDCNLRVHHTQDTPTENSIEICGTPYVVDEGTGYGEVKQDCEYQVQLNYCLYSVDEWTAVDTITSQGEDTNPVWPAVDLTTNQRSGEQVERYQIGFSADDETYPFITSDYSLFQMAAPGSAWELTVDGFGNVVSAQPR